MKSTHISPNCPSHLEALDCGGEVGVDGLDSIGEHLSLSASDLNTLELVELHTRGRGRQGRCAGMGGQNREGQHISAQLIKSK